MKVTLFVALLLVVSVPVSVRSQDSASKLQQFEANWLRAILNEDKNWFGLLSEGKLIVAPDGDVALDERRRLVGDLTGGLSPTESKVRISGTISVLSNEPGRARSFQFLDTFNKKNGKWEMIATSLSAVSDLPDSIRSKPVESQLVDFENALAQAEVTNDPTTLDRIIAPEFVSTSITGDVRDRGQWLDARKSESIRSALNTDIQVHAVSESLAIVTGIELTTRNETSGQRTVHQDRFTDTWVRRPQGWQIVARHVTRLR